MSAPSSRSRPRRIAAASGALTLTLVIAACGGSPAATGGGGGGGGEAGGGAECADFEQFGDLAGQEISVYSPITDPQDAPLIESFTQFEECTGADVVYEGSREFEAQLQVRIQGGNAPDIAFIPQPGLLQTLVQDTGAVQAAPAPVVSNVEQYYPETYRNAASVDGTLYAAPLGANVKSYVWYSPSAFAENGYTVPTTWDEMVALSEQIAASGNTPWCAGIESGEATGWVLTDWTEDVVLREGGVEVYDQWVNHEIPFNSPEIVAAVDRVGAILKNPAFVGDPTAIATTPFGDGGLPILDGACYMHRQADFYGQQWPEGTTVAEDGDVFAFPLPPVDPSRPTPVLVGGEFVAAFNGDPATVAFQTFLSGPVWPNLKAQADEALGGGWVSANSGLDPANLISPIDQLSAETLQDTSNEFRFDGSDLMPAAVGSGTFWSGMTSWITGTPTQETLTQIESSWPQ